MIFTNLAPNTQFGDAFRAFGLILTPWRWKKGKGGAELEECLGSLLPGHRVFTFESGRTSLHAILTALDIRAGDEVLLQTYTCVAVPEPVLWVGATPVYVDCDETLTMSVPDLEKKITPHTKAIIVQHTFGMPSHLDAILALAKNHNLFVIEDCAHALGSTYNHQAVGTFGDASFFSFGRDKVISSVFGGAAATKHKHLAEAISKMQSEYPLPRAGWVFQQLLHPPIMWLGKKTYRIGGVALIWLTKTLHITSRAVYPEEKEGVRPQFALHRMPNALAKLALRQIKKLEYFNAHRKEVAALYQKLLPASLSRQLPTASSNSIWLRYTLWVDQAANIKEAARKQRILLGDWYDTPIAPRGVNYEKIGYRPGSCPNAERIARGTINLPTDIHTSFSDVKKIADIVIETLKTPKA